MSTDNGMVVAMPRQAPATQAVSAADMIMRALERGASIEVLEKLLELQERHAANQARVAFERAMADARGELPVIIKDSEVYYKHRDGSGTTNYKHETLAGISRVIDPILSRHGLGYRFEVSQDVKSVVVTCVISHAEGHSVRVTLKAPEDPSGNKNAVQAIGSVVTYLQRYTLKLALGLSAGEDDDGRAAGGTPAIGGPISAEQLAKLQEAIDEVSADVPAFCRYFKVDRIADLPASRFDAAIAALAKKRQG